MACMEDQAIGQRLTLILEEAHLGRARLGAKAHL